MNSESLELNNSGQSKGVTKSLEAVSESRRMQVVLNADTAQKLDSLARKRNTSTTHIIRQAVRTEDLLQKEIEAGSKIIIQRPDGTLREIILN